METNELSFYRVIFPSHSQPGKWRVENIINAPRVCPVCGSKDVSKLIKLGTTNLTFLGSSGEKSIYIKIWVCRAHEKLKTPRPKTLRDAPLSFEYLRAQSVIHAAREDWVAKFTALNAGTSVVAGRKPFDMKNVALTKTVLNVIYGWIASIVLCLVTLIVNQSLGNSSLVLTFMHISGGIAIGFTIAVLIGIFYLSLYKLPILREIDYFGKRLHRSWRYYIQDPLGDFLK